MKKGNLLLMLLIVVSFMVQPVFSQSEKPRIAPICKQCHAPNEKVLRGNFMNVSQRVKTIQIQTGPATWIVNYDDNTRLIGAEEINKIPKEKEIAIEIEERNGQLYAKTISVKLPTKVPEEKLIKVEELARLIDIGPEKAKFFLVDSRPAPRYHEGHIPYAVSIYDAEFDKHVEKLPKDKDMLLIFYCGGVTCRLSPNSARKAEKLGYKNVKVFHDGMPEWKKAGKLVLSTVNFIKDNMDKDIPQVIIDLRPSEEASKGFIPGAVSIPSEMIANMKDKFPADKKAPIILYSYDTNSAIDAFRIVRGWGYSNTSVLEGGIVAWQMAGFNLAQGKLADTIVYVPKPRPGEILVEEFKRIVETMPSDKFILDVRDEDEAMEGMLRNAKNIPLQEIPKRLSEIPKDKEIIIHCVGGVRAEMAYHMLKEAGYNARFLNAIIKIDKDGKYEIRKE